MRVLIVHPHMAVYGGAETVVHHLSKCLNSYGFENKVMTLSLTEEVRKICNDIDFILPEGERFDFNLRSTGVFTALGLLGEIKALHRMIKCHAEEFDVVNLHNFPATWAAYKIDRPTVWMCNEPPELWNNPSPSILLKALYTIGYGADRYMVNRFIDIICVADDFNKDRVLKRYGRNSNVIPYGVEYELFATGDGRDIRNRYKLDDRFVVLQVGMIGPQKNQMASVEAVHELRINIKNILLVLAGMGGNDYEREIKIFIKKHKLEPHILFTGHVDKDEVKNLYHACNVAIFPVKTQGGWLSPFEALSAARPIIVSPLMGAAGLIERERLGFVTDRYTDTIMEVYKRPEHYYSSAKRAQVWVRENLSWDNFTKKMVEVFKKATNSN